MTVQIKSTAQEIHAVFNDPDLYSFKAERFRFLKQQFQHELVDDQQLDMTTQCLRSTPAKLQILFT